MKVIFYARVSTADQEDRGTIKMQFDQVQRAAEAQGWEIVQTYQDEDASGTLMLEERPGGAQLLNELARHKSKGVTHVVFYEWSRLARDPCVFWDAVHRIERKGGLTLRSITEREETSDPDGVLLLCIRNGINYTERIRTVRRSIDATEMLVRQGVWMGGVVPYGYRQEGSRREARIVPATDPIPGMELSEVDVVRLIFRLCAEEHLSTVQIADKLNALGIPPTYSRPGSSKRKRKLSGLWTNSRICNLLAMTTYKGVHTWGKRTDQGAGLRKGATIERGVPAIVDADTWQRAQRVLRENALWADRNVKRDYLLRGLIRCGECGCSYVGTVATDREGGEYRYYRCAGRPRTRKACKSRSVPSALEERVWSDITAFLMDPEAAAQEAADQLAAESGVQTSALEIETAKRRLQQCKDGRDRLLLLLRRGSIEFDVCEQQLAEIQREENALKAQLAVIEAGAAVIHAHHALLTSAAIVLRLVRERIHEGDLTPGTKRAVVEFLVDGITVTNDPPCSNIAVRYRFPARDGPLARDCSPVGCPIGAQTPAIERRKRHCGVNRWAYWE